MADLGCLRYATSTIRAALYARVSASDLRASEPACVLAGGRWTARLYHGGRLPPRGDQWRHGSRQAAWTACAAEGCRRATLRHYRRIAGVPPESIAQVI